jgi:glutamine synthetase type III
MLKELANNHNVKFILVSFTDLQGRMRSKLVPVSAIDQLMEGGASFAGFAGGYDLRASDTDIVVLPEAETFLVLPWNSEVAWVTGDLYKDGEPLSQCPRNQLKSNFEKAKEDGFIMKTGVEPEFFLLDGEKHAIFDKKDKLKRPCYDQLTLMRSYHVVSEICESLDALGWSPYQNDHEDANGQFEINWGYSDATVTADRHAFFKFAVKSIAEKHGLRATFMPKPFGELTGNGCHVHCSLWDKNGSNAFSNTVGGREISDVGRYFIGGLLEHSSAISAFSNPSVNSYKRMQASALSTTSGEPWVSQALAWSNNRSTLIRVPDPHRCELRSPDGAANPYLLQLSILIGGMIGVKNKIDPGLPGEVFHSQTSGKSFLPLGLLDSLNSLEADLDFIEFAGSNMVQGYIEQTKSTFKSYMHSVSQWEIDNTVDC